MSLLRISVFLVLGVLAGANRYPQRTYTNAQYVAAPSQQVPKVAKGYNYQVPVGAPSVNQPQVVPRPGPASTPATGWSPPPAPKPSQTSVKAAESQAVPVVDKLETAAATDAEGRSLQHQHMAQIQTIDVACGKERMTVRIAFDQAFNGVIYAKGHYKNPACRFVNANSGQRMYQFEMAVGTCGVAFNDAGLTSGGQAYLEGLLVVILQDGVQEAWDAARRIRCLWEGNIDQTVTVPLSVNMLDAATLTFSGDTASAALEIQTGRGPRAPVAQGLVRIGDLLTAVVTVVGDPDFDLIVRNCVATDGTPNNRVILSDNQGCATMPKLMGGWQKQRNPGNLLAFAYLSAFKFPDLMDLFLECTVSLCKGACQECPNFQELHVHSPDTTSADQQIEPRINANPNVRVKRHVSNATVPTESLHLRRVLHVISPDDFPELASAASSPAVVYGQSDCFSLMTVVGSALIAIVLILSAATILSFLRRGASRVDDTIKIYGPTHRP